MHLSQIEDEISNLVDVVNEKYFSAHRNGLVIGLIGWLSIGGRLFLVKSILESIPVY